MLHIWPAFPITARISNLYQEIPENAVATLEQNDRIREIYADGISGDGFDDSDGAGPMAWIH